MSFFLHGFRGLISPSSGDDHPSLGPSSSSDFGSVLTGLDKALLS